MGEEWRDIPGYKGMYQVSNMGEVRSLDRTVEVNKFTGKHKRLIKGRLLKTGLSTSGYRIVVLCKESAPYTKQISKLMGVCFLGHNPGKDGMVVDHIDGVKTNDKLNNLQLITQRENTSKDRIGGTSKYTGVHWSKTENKWRSAIRINGKVVRLGDFKNEIDAANAYQNRLKKIII